ncbi:hypothetical protein CRG98_031194 [Punica granatum]|uniref:Uncharacterized protein n=1 Tax=Punica granatum TaxID=22663 RepID=A0A2I0IWV9_PUNGR|nr:hypothetical protein CRG98_031194 [Punica granatum]
MAMKKTTLASFILALVLIALAESGNASKCVDTCTPGCMVQTKGKGTWEECKAACEDLCFHMDRSPGRNCWADWMCDWGDWA